MSCMSCQDFLNRPQKLLNLPVVVLNLTTYVNFRFLIPQNNRAFITILRPFDKNI